MGAKPNKTDANKKKMLEELKKSLGIISTACDKAGIHRSTHYDWLEKDPEYAKEVEHIDERTGDFVEGSLLKKINSGDTTAIIFYAKTRLKGRGYIERKELTGADGKDIIPDMRNLTAEELMVLADKLSKKDD